MTCRKQFSCRFFFILIQEGEREKQISMAFGDGALGGEQLLFQVKLMQIGFWKLRTNSSIGSPSTLGYEKFSLILCFISVCMLLNRQAKVYQKRFGIPEPFWYCYASAISGNACIYYQPQSILCLYVGWNLPGFLVHPDPRGHPLRRLLYCRFKIKREQPAL